MSQAEENGASGEKVSRRKVLRYIGFAAIGAAVAVGVGSVLGKPSSTQSGADPAPSNLTSPVAQLAEPGASTITVQVNYFQMPNINPNQDSFVLQNPATYEDLVSQVLQKHPELTAMMPTMMAFVDGYYAKNGMALKNGDQVDFVPLMAGG